MNELKIVLRAASGAILMCRPHFGTHISLPCTPSHGPTQKEYNSSIVFVSKFSKEDRFVSMSSGSIDIGTGKWCCHLEERERESSAFGLRSTGANTEESQAVRMPPEAPSASRAA